MTEFRHAEKCMGTVFQYWGNADRDSVDLDLALEKSVSVLHEADETFSLYKPESPVSKLARGEVSIKDLPEIVEYIWDECEKWEVITDGYFSAMTAKNTFDPSGLVKSWATNNAALKLEELGITDFAINAGGDIRLSKHRSSGLAKRIGVSKPVSIATSNSEALTVLDLNDADLFAVATSGTAERGEHIWNPRAGRTAANELAQVSVIASDIVTADVFATALFAAGKQANQLLEKHAGEFEAIVVDLDGKTFLTPGVTKLLAPL
ncbi:MAG: hypothetical protein RIQ88_278 [Actinomycetota bacterium]|jgi:FAD:protein FMN transferase